MNCPTRTGASVHAPFPQLGRFIGQAIPHLEQFFGSVNRLVSQPFIGFPSQSAKPALHLPRTQLPAAQLAVALGSPLQGWLQAPQLAGSLKTDVSQPFISLLSQSAKPKRQEVM